MKRESKETISLLVMLAYVGAAIGALILLWFDMTQGKDITQDLIIFFGILIMGKLNGIQE